MLKISILAHACKSMHIHRSYKVRYSKIACLNPWFHSLNLLTLLLVTELCAHHFGLFFSPQVITHCGVAVTPTEFHTACQGAISTHQSNITIFTSYTWCKNPFSDSLPIFKARIGIITHMTMHIKSSKRMILSF